REPSAQGHGPLGATMAPRRTAPRWYTIGTLARTTSQRGQAGAPGGERDMLAPVGLRAPKAILPEARPGCRALACADWANCWGRMSQLAHPADRALSAQSRQCVCASLRLSK